MSMLPASKSPQNGPKNKPKKSSKFQSVYWVASLYHGVSEAEGGRGERVEDAGVNLGVVVGVGGGAEVQVIVDLGSDHLPKYFVYF